MGMRPSFKLVVGVKTRNIESDPRFDFSVATRRKAEQGCDLSDWIMPAYYDKDNYDFFTERVKGMDKERPWVPDLYYRGNPMAWRKGGDIVGYIVDEIDNSPIMYVLMNFLESMTKEIIEVPSIVKKGDLAYRNYVADGGKRNKEKREKLADLAIAEHRWIANYSIWATNRWYTAAIFMLNYVGWEGLYRKDLRIYLVREWS